MTPRWVAGGLAGSPGQRQHFAHHSNHLTGANRLAQQAHASRHKALEHMLLREVVEHHRMLPANHLQSCLQVATGLRAEAVQRDEQNVDFADLRQVKVGPALGGSDHLNRPASPMGGPELLHEARVHNRDPHLGNDRGRLFAGHRLQQPHGLAHLVALVEQLPNSVEPCNVVVAVDAVAVLGAVGLDHLIAPLPRQEGVARNAGQAGSGLDAVGHGWVRDKNPLYCSPVPSPPKTYTKAVQGGCAARAPLPAATTP